MQKHYSERRTEDVTIDLLNIQGWDSLSRPPRGRLLRQNEYKDFQPLRSLFAGKSKSGGGDAYPDFLLVDESACIPQVVIETKAKQSDFDEAIADAKHYADACLSMGHEVVAIGVAGQEKTGMSVRVFKFTPTHRKWEAVTHEGRPTSWIPTPHDTEKLIAARSLIDLAPVVPRPEVLSSKADGINRLLRVCRCKGVICQTGFHAKTSESGLPQ